MIAQRPILTGFTSSGAGSGVHQCSLVFSPDHSDTHVPKHTGRPIYSTALSDSISLSPKKGYKGSPQTPTTQTTEPVPSCSKGSMNAACLVASIAA